MDTQHGKEQKETIATRVDEETLKSISKPPEFEKQVREANPSRFDLLLAEDAKITSREIIESFGKRVDELRKRGIAGEKVTEKELALTCGVTVQTISNIIKGTGKSVNISLCNKLAEYFECSAYYILGVTAWENGVLIDGKPFKLPFRFDDDQDTINITQAGQWARKDPELFAILERLFQVDSETRVIIRNAIKLMLR